MTSITSWIRLEPVCRNDALSPGLDARIHDGLWFLARQWQLGEFIGDDAGTPVAVRVRGEAAPLDVGGAPFAVEVEAIHRANRVGADVRDRVEAGAHLLRMLAAAKLDKPRKILLERYRLSMPTSEDDEPTRTLLLASVGRVADGRLAHDELAPLLSNGGSLPSTIGISVTDHDRTVDVVRTWLAWYASTVYEPTQSSWNANRLEYAFASKLQLSDRDVTLGAREYDGTGLDWHSFEMLTSTPASREPRAFVRTVQPMLARYRGMPSSRYWELEDASVDFGAVDARAGDIPRLLLTEFALVYGADWFIAPVQLDLGSAYRVASVVVTDSFGVRTLVPSYLADPASAQWRMFATSGTEDVLVLASSPRIIESAPVEQVDFLRDEAANLVWGIERRYEALDGSIVDRTSSGRPPPPTAVTQLTYRLAQQPAPNWIPLKPADEYGLQLEPAAFAQVSTSQPLLGAQGSILRTPRIAEDEVPSEGIRVSRVYRFARSFDGRSLLWLAYLKRPGGEPAASALRYDQVLEP